MNRYQAVLNASSDEELKEAIRELKALDENSVRPTGALLRMHDSLYALGLDTSETIIGVLRCGLHERGAQQWAES